MTAVHSPLRDLARFVAHCMLDTVLIAIFFKVGIACAHVVDPRVPDLDFWAVFALAMPTAALIRAIQERRW